MKILADVCTYTKNHTVAVLDGKKVLSEMNVPINDVVPSIKSYVSNYPEIDEDSGVCYSEKDDRLIICAGYFV